MPDNIVIREDTRFRVLKRNVERIPRGSEVRIVSDGNTIGSIYGKFDGDVHDESFVLMGMDSDLCVAFSDDKEDLVILVVENGWWFSGPKEINDIVILLQGIV